MDQDQVSAVVLDSTQNGLIGWQPDTEQKADFPLIVEVVQYKYHRSGDNGDLIVGLKLRRHFFWCFGFLVEIPHRGWQSIPSDYVIGEPVQ